MENRNFFMQEALREAKEAYERDSVPVGAVIIRNNQIISKAGNEVIKRHDPTAHAEILAIRHAASLIKSEFLDDCEIYVTLEPCAMCAQAISLARIKRLYFGAYDQKYGAVIHGSRIFEHAIHKTEVISGVFESQCSEILQDFFKTKRY